MSGQFSTLSQDIFTRLLEIAKSHAYDPHLSAALENAISGCLGTSISTCLLHPLEQLAPTYTGREAECAAAQNARPTTYEISNSESGAESGNIGRATISHDPENPVGAFSRIYSEAKAIGSDGAGAWRALYGGLATDLGRFCTDSFLYFFLYEAFRGWRLQRRVDEGKALKDTLGAVEELAVGVLAGAVTRAVTVPIHNGLQRRIAEMKEEDEHEEHIHWFQAIQSIYQEQGVKGLWSGYAATLIMTLNPSITFYLNQFLNGRLMSPDQRVDPGFIQTFLIAGSSKAIANALTYPIRMAKARQRTGLIVGELDTYDLDAKTATRGEYSAVKNEAVDMHNVAKEIEAKLTKAQSVRRFMRQSVLGTVWQLTRIEGLGSLFHGISLELLLGFLGHGITMTVKSVAKRLLFRLYLVAAALLQELRVRSHDISMPNLSLRDWSPATNLIETIKQHIPTLDQFCSHDNKSSHNDGSSSSDRSSKHSNAIYRYYTRRPSSEVHNDHPGLDASFPTNFPAPSNNTREPPLHRSRFTTEPPSPPMQHPHHYQIPNPQRTRPASMAYLRTSEGRPQRRRRPPSPTIRPRVVVPSHPHMEHWLKRQAPMVDPLILNFGDGGARGVWRNSSV